MSLRDKLPGRFIFRRMADGRPSGPYSNTVAHDEEGLEVAIETALSRPFDAFNWETGDVDCGGKVVLRVEFAGVLGPPQHPIERPTRPSSAIQKRPLPPAAHLKPLPTRPHEKRRAKVLRRGRK